MKLWPIIAAVFGPGVAQALVGRRRIAIGFAAAFALAVFALAFTIHGIAIAGAVWVASLVDTIVYVARTPAVSRDRTHEAAIVWAALVVVGGVTKLFLAEALPGEIVEMRGDATPCEPQRHYVVPPGHVFVLGDNRGNSNDSRYWGSVPIANIKGKMIGIWLPLARFGAL